MNVPLRLRESACRLGGSLMAISMLLSVGAASPATIIIRHDTSDAAYVALANDVPAVAAVVRYNTTDVAGTLISPRWILSAAHVAETIEPGKTLVTSTGDSVAVESVVIHPGWIDNGRPEDIALLRLRRPVPDVRPVPLYTDRDEQGKKVLIAGNGDFGTGRTGPQRNDGQMRAATNRVDGVSNEYLTWRFDDPRTDSTSATRLEGISGPGDSGGPAFIHVDGAYRLAGVSSGQSTDATNGKEGRYGVTEYYTRVSTYATWIRQTIAD